VKWHPDARLRRVFLVGLAFDFCVGWSAEDAQHQGFVAIVVEDACRAIDVDGSVTATRRRLAARGIACIEHGAVAAVS